MDLAFNSSNNRRLKQSVLWQAAIESCKNMRPVEKGKEITANCLHPGSLLDTKMVREGFYAPMGSPQSGADVEVYAAAAPGLEGKTGIYFNEKRPARASAQAYDPEARKSLRQLAEQFTGIR